MSKPLPKIYLWFNNFIEDTMESTGEAYAISEDGEILGHHICSDESFVPGDLEYREKYNEYYPNGYELEFIPWARLSSHTGLNEALKLYDIKYKSANA